MPLRYLYVTGLLWLALPMLLFLGSWVTPWLGWPLCAVLVASLGMAVKRLLQIEGKITLDRTAWCIVLLTAVLIFCSGVGGFFFQMEWDHKFRNELYNQLVHNPWPVINTDLEHPRMLTYFIAIWLPPAVVAKLTGSDTLGNVALLIYAYVGFMTAVLLIMNTIANGRVKAWFTMVLFSPWYLPTSAALLIGEHPHFVRSLNFLCENNDLCTVFFSAPPLSILLFWIYNQGVAAWLGLSVMYLQRERPGIMMLVYGLLILFSPITCIAVMPVVGWWLLRHWRSSITLPNVLGVVLCLVSAVYFTANTSQHRLVFEGNSALKYFGMMALFLLISYGVYMPWMWGRVRRDRLFWVLLTWSLLLSVIRIGEDYDFGWRVGIPAMCYFTYLVMQQVAATDWRRPRAWLFGLFLLVGAVSNFTYFRAFRGEYRYLRYGAPRRSDALLWQLWDPDTNPCYPNFVGKPNWLIKQ